MNLADEENFRDLLTRDHARLDAMLASVMDLARVNVQPSLDQQWAAYEESLLAHMDAEELFLLPGLAAHEPRIAARIREEHAKFRSLLADVGVGLELHIASEDQMLELARRLRAHAQMEEQSLYAWADAELPKAHFSSVLHRLRATWDRITRSETPQQKTGTLGQASIPAWAVSRRL